LLDAGCGAGGALVAAARRGLEVCGTDPSVNLLAVARERLPQADVRVGELESLPFSNDAFDAAIAINSLQYAANPQLAVDELGRVCRAGGRVAIVAHCDPELSDMNAVTEAILNLFPRRPSGGPFALAQVDAVQSLVRNTAALEVATVREFEHCFDYPSLDTAVRGMMAAGGSRRACEIFGDDTVRAVTREAVAPLVRPDASVRLRNWFRCVVALKKNAGQ
jgi:SAM-dependent methyltransferase